MSKITELVELMRSLEDQLVVCMRCGMCHAVCPLYAQTGREADVARGKLALLDGLLKEMFADPDGVVDRLNRCLLCGSCAANCPSGVNVLEIFLKARAILTGYAGLPAAQKAVLRGMLAHPQRFDRLAEWGAKFQSIFTRPVNEVLGTSCARFVSPLITERHFLPLAKQPFHRLINRLETEPADQQPRVAFFVGCLIDKVFPRIGQAVVDVLDKNQVGLFVPEAQGCCGIPALSSGDLDTFQQLVTHNLNRFGEGDYDYLVTACATCTSTIKKIWPRFVDPKQKTQVAALAEKTLDISQLIVDVIGLPAAHGESDHSGRVVTYHDPCHLKKSLGVNQQPRLLVSANNTYRLHEMAEADSCCGMGGSFNLKFYDISSQIGTLKRQHIEATGCEVVATSCPACMMQISDMLSKAGSSIAVRHPVELYADWIKAHADSI